MGTRTARIIVERSQHVDLQCSSALAMRRVGNSTKFDRLRWMKQYLAVQVASASILQHSATTENTSAGYNRKTPSASRMLISRNANAVVLMDSPTDCPHLQAILCSSFSQR